MEFSELKTMNAEGKLLANFRCAQKKYGGIVKEIERMVQNQDCAAWL